MHSFGKEGEGFRRNGFLVDGVFLISLFSFEGLGKEEERKKEKERQNLTLQSRWTRVLPLEG